MLTTLTPKTKYTGFFENMAAYIYPSQYESYWFCGVVQDGYINYEKHQVSEASVRLFLDSCEFRSSEAEWTQEPCRTLKGCPFGKGRVDPFDPECILRDRIAAELSKSGFSVETECYMALGGRADIVVWNDDSKTPCMIIETKIFNPLDGIGQLFAYSASWGNAPKKVLAITKELKSPLLEMACAAAGVELWIK